MISSVGHNRVQWYTDILKDHPEWTPKTLSEMPLAQLLAIYAAKDDVFGSLDEAMGAINEVRAKKGLPPLTVRKETDDGSGK